MVSTRRRRRGSGYPIHRYLARAAAIVSDERRLGIAGRAVVRAPSKNFAPAPTWMMLRVEQSPLTQSWYHIVVLGTDLSGVVFAALAARIGYRVLVIGQGDRPVAYKREGHWFLRRPERFLGFSTSPAVQRALGDLSLGFEMKNRPQALEPALQVAMPGMRLDLGGARRHWERDLERELPGCLPLFDGFDARMAELTRLSSPLVSGPRPTVARALGEPPPDTEHLSLPPRGLRDRAMFKKLAEDLPPSALDPAFDILGEIAHPRARAVIEGPLTHLSGLVTQPLAPLVVARLWTHLRAGLYRFPGGLDGLKQVFVRKIRDQSSDVRPDAYASAFVMKRGRVVAVQLAERGETIGCDLVVGNVDPRKVLALVPREERDDGWHQAAGALEPVAWRLVVNLGVDPRVLPEGMAPELLWIDDPHDPLRDDNALWVSRPGIGPHAGGDGRPGPGVVQLTSLLEARSVVPTLGGIERNVTRSLDALRRLVPWLDEHIKVIDVPALHDAVTAARARKNAGLAAGSGAAASAGGPQGDAHHPIDENELVPVFGRALPDTLGASAFAPETAYKNLLLAGDQLFAGLGFEGTCLAALQALHLTRERVKLKTGLRGERTLI